MNTNQLVAFLQLIRWKNLLFLAITLCLMQWAVAAPILNIYGFAEVLNSMQTLLLVLGTVLIAGGGYAINDYFDVKIDAINKPETRVVGRLMDRRRAMVYHQVLTGTGVLCGIVLAIWLRSFTLGLLFVFVPGLLWFYSATYKRQFIIGNIIVAFQTALSVLQVAIANVAALEHAYGDLIFQTHIPVQLYAWIGGFALFAFLCTHIREIIKDIEDEKGDREMECHTLPIKLGHTRTKIVLYFLIAITAGLLCYATFGLIAFRDNGLTAKYLIFGLLLPLAVLVYLIASAHSSLDFRNASGMCKFIMGVGVLYSLVFYYLLAKTSGISFLGL